MPPGPGQVVSQLRLLPRAMQAMILLGFMLHFHMDLIYFNMGILGLLHAFTI